MEQNNAPTRSTTYKNADVIDAFRAGTATDGMQNATGTLRVEKSRNGDLNLIGYGWMLYAKYQQSTDTITAFTGHVDYAESIYQNIGTSTVRKHFNENRYGGVGGIEHIADTLSPASPTVAEPPESVKDIGSWGKIRDYYENHNALSEDEEQTLRAPESVSEELEDLFNPA